MMRRDPFSWSAWLRSPAGLVLLGFLAVAAFFLLTEHTAHVFGLLPYFLLLLCPLMHLFMHGGHGGHGTPDGHDAHAGHAAHAEHDLAPPRDATDPGPPRGGAR